MKHGIRVFFAVLLLAAGIFALPAAAARADDVYSEGPLYYTIGNESVTIVGCFGKHEEIEVPAMIAGYPVNTIASGAFVGNEYLKVLKLPDTISTIEPGAIDPGIYVIYNANTDHPQDTPTDLILGLLDPVPSETEEPAPAENPPEETPTPIPQGSGEENFDEDGQETTITERDEDLDIPEETPGPSPSPAPEESPAPTETPAAEKAEETPSPEQPAEGEPEADTESGDTSAEPGSSGTEQDHTGTLAGVLGGVALLAGGTWLLSKRRKTED